MTHEPPTETCYIVTLNNNILYEGTDYTVDPEGCIQLKLDIEDDDTVVAYEVIGRKRILHEP